MDRIHLKQLKDSPDWLPVRKALIEAIPPSPEWKPGMSDDDWKYQSAVRTGYLIALSQLGVTYE